MVQKIMMLLISSADTWSVPEITGTRPEPCADVTFTSIDKQQGIFYGGRERVRLYLFDIDSMVTIHDYHPARIRKG